MNSMQIVTAIEWAFKSGQSFNMPPMTGAQFAEVIELMGIGK